jgi:hypothetical protein
VRLAALGWELPQAVYRAEARIPVEAPSNETHAIMSFRYERFGVLIKPIDTRIRRRAYKAYR